MMIALCLGSSSLLMLEFLIDVFEQLIHHSWSSQLPSPILLPPSLLYFPRLQVVWSLHPTQLVSVEDAESPKYKRELTDQRKKRINNK